MKNRYIELMERTLSAYSDEHIVQYFNDVRANGLTEHGFPRLTANIGILIAHGRRVDLLPLFLEMMSFCCHEIPRVKAANDFSVREVICCLREIERSGRVSPAVVEEWKNDIRSIEPASCYSVMAVSPDIRVNNWALFTGVSEFFRQNAGLCHSEDFIDLQLANQLNRLDENSMYCDAKTHEHQPIQYDLVPRGLFAALLNEGYRGVHYQAIDDCLRRAGLLTLQMQSPNGEIGFGGRSNQFLLGEGWLMAVYEYEAHRYAREGNAKLAAAFKAAIARAMHETERWLDKQPIRHIKNYFPTETQYGCESYAYFNKYMITAASNLYAAYLMCDDSIAFEERDDVEPVSFCTSTRFHKLFLKAGGYGVEFDWNADPLYDASGLGRVHRAGAPSAICLSCPCPQAPNYVLNIEDPMDCSLCAAVLEEGEWRLGAAPANRYEVLEHGTDDGLAFAEFCCHFASGRSVNERYRVDADGVEISLEGEGTIGFALPAFCFDGEKSPRVVADEHTLCVFYEGWACRYETDGRIVDLERLAANRNGHYRVFLASAQSKLGVRITIEKQ